MHYEAIIVETLSSVCERNILEQPRTLTLALRLQEYECRESSDKVTLKGLHARRSHRVALHLNFWPSLIFIISLIYNFLILH